MRVKKENREKVIMGIINLLQLHPFSFEFKVKKKPSGIKVIYEVTQSELDDLIKGSNEK